MKTNTVSIRQEYRDPLADAQYQHAEDMLMSLAHEQGKADGTRNIPRTADELKAHFANTVHTEIQQCLNEHAVRSQNITGILQAKKIEQAAKEKVHLLRASLTEDQAQLRILEKQADRLKPNRRYDLIRLLVAIGLVVIAISEGILSYPSFRAIALPTINAIASAVAVSIAVAICAPMCAAWIRKAKSPLQYRLRLYGSHAVAFTFFLFLAVVRLHGYNAAASIDLDASEITAAASRPDFITALAICFVSMILFCIALYASIRYHKTKAEYENDHEYREAQRKADNLADGIHACARQITAIESNSQLEQAEALAKYEFACGHQQRLIGLGAKALTLYGKTNMNYRSDGACPEFFADLPEHHYTATFQHTN